MKSTDLTSAVCLELFNMVSDSEGCNTPRYGRANRQAEYGISRADFINEKDQQAIDDAQEYFDKQTDERKAVLVKAIAEGFEEEAKGKAYQAKLLRALLDK